MTLGKTITTLVLEGYLYAGVSLGSLCSFIFFAWGLLLIWMLALSFLSAHGLLLLDRGVQVQGTCMFLGRWGQWAALVCRALGSDPPVKWEQHLGPLLVTGCVHS